MARRVRLHTDQVIAQAVAIVDRDGYERLSLSVVATELGVGPSALYSHVGSLDGLRAVVAAASAASMAERARAAAIGTSGDAAVEAVARAYREFALTHPGRFAAMVSASAGDDDTSTDAVASMFDVLRLVYRAAGRSDIESAAAADALGAAIHGAVVLEHSGMIDGSDERLAAMVATICRGIG